MLAKLGKLLEGTNSTISPAAFFFLFLRLWEAVVGCHAPTLHGHTRMDEEVEMGEKKRGRGTGECFLFLFSQFQTNCCVGRSGGIIPVEETGRGEISYF